MKSECRGHLRDALMTTVAEVAARATPATGSHIKPPNTAPIPTQKATHVQIVAVFIVKSTTSMAATL